MKFKKVQIKQTRHKEDPFLVTLLGHTKSTRRERFATLRTAQTGAVNTCGDWIRVDSTNRGVHILMPNKKMRDGFIHNVGIAGAKEKIVFSEIVDQPKPKKK